MAERDQVIEEVSEVLRSRAVNEARGRHLSADEIVAYHEESLPPQRQSAFQEHFANCGECTGLLLELVGFEDLASPPDHATEAVPDFSSLKKSLDLRIADEAGTRVRKALLAAPRPTKFRVPRPYWAVLAASLLAVLALGTQVWISSAPRERATEVFILSPDGYRAEAVSTLRLPIWADSYLLSLSSVESLGQDTVGAQLRDEQGRTVLTADALHRSADGTFRWTLDRANLKAGSYSLRLLGSDGEVLDSFRFSLVMERASD